MLDFDAGSLMRKSMLKAKIIFFTLLIAGVDSITQAMDIGLKPVNLPLQLPSALVVKERLINIGVKDFVEKTKIHKVVGGKKYSHWW